MWHWLKFPLNYISFIGWSRCLRPNPCPLQTSARQAFVDNSFIAGRWSISQMGYAGTFNRVLEIAGLRWRRIQLRLPTDIATERPRSHLGLYQLNDGKRSTAPTISDWRLHPSLLARTFTWKRTVPSAVCRAYAISAIDMPLARAITISHSASESP